MTRYFTETRTRKYLKGYECLSFARTLSNKNKKTIFDTATKTGLDNVKTVSKKVVHKTDEAPREFIGNRITDKIVKPKHELEQC